MPGQPSHSVGAPEGHASGAAEVAGYPWVDTADAGLLSSTDRRAAPLLTRGESTRILEPFSPSPHPRAPTCQRKDLKVFFLSYRILGLFRPPLISLQCPPSLSFPPLLGKEPAANFPLKLKSYPFIRLMP